MRKILIAFATLIFSVFFSQESPTGKFAKNQVEKNTIKSEEPYVIVDDKDMSFEDLNKIDPKLIDSVFVVKEKKSLELFGEKAKYGAIIIKLKKHE